MGDPAELSEARFTVRDVSGIGRDPVNVYQDPSNIMQIGDRYYVWYTRYPHDESWMTTWRTSNCTKIWLATSADGVSWLEHGQVLEDSDQAAWHGEGKHAPSVAYHDGKYYLYFCAHTGAPVNEKHIGVALADSPEGPLQTCSRRARSESDPRRFLLRRAPHRRPVCHRQRWSVLDVLQRQDQYAEPVYDRPRGGGESNGTV